ncbi:DUF4270 family protein [Ferruginibacter profundus]
MTIHKHLPSFFCLFVLTIILASCDKVDITFGATPSTSDPNITYFDNYKTDIATYKPDSFITSGHQVLSIGYHYDSVFGVVKAGSYSQINLPATNPLLNVTETILFDSLQLLIKPSGEFYGDSTKPVKINVFRLTQNIKTDDNSDTYYNTTTFNYNPVMIGQQIINLNSKSGTAVSVKLSDVLGQELLSKFKSNDLDITTQENFINYFKGIYITTDSVVTNSLAYFTADTDSVMLKLNYHQNGTSPQAKTLDFRYEIAKQFNNIGFRFTNSNFSSFLNKKTQVIASTASGNKSFLNSNLGACIKVSFPGLLSLKELHPYIKVVKAILVIKPDATSSGYPYQLPKTLNMYGTDQGNELLSALYDDGVNPALQTGNLVVDNLYNENTYYSFDITKFIDTKISEGQASTSALLLYPSLGYQDGGLQRLIVNDQNNNRPIQLKLYVLGL